MCKCFSPKTEKKVDSLKTDLKENNNSIIDNNNLIVTKNSTKILFSRK